MTALHRRLFGIDKSETSFSKRGFAPVAPEIQNHLESIGQTFVLGYHAALESDAENLLIRRLEDAAPSLTGFAYEGAAMGLAVMDWVLPRQPRRLRNFLQGPGAAHKYMVHVGAGWAMARVPWPLGFGLRRLDPLLGCLAVDGYGFHQGYFKHKQYVDAMRQPRLPSPQLFHAFYQGLGRSLWFSRGADPVKITATIQRFPTQFQGDMWSGIGLASTYAGGVAAEQLQYLLTSASEYRPQLAQGAAFAAKARSLASNIVPHTEQACELFCGIDASAAAAITDSTMPSQVGQQDNGSAYAYWRQQISQAITTYPFPSKDPVPYTERGYVSSKTGVSA